MANGGNVILGAVNDATSSTWVRCSAANPYEPSLLVLSTGPADGVQGYATSGAGVYGGSTRGRGVYGFSSTSAGVVGLGRTAGVYGWSREGAGVVGQTFNENDYAGFFWGRVWVTSDFIVSGAKSAAVRHPDGTQRLLYSIESP